MMKRYLFILLVIMCNNLNAQSKKILFETNYGNFKVLLYDFTPRHQQLLLNAIKSNVYKEATFNRVIKNFVVQGGVHDDEIAKQELGLPEIEKKRLPAEFDSRAIHKIGALGAGRDENNEKASFLNQIYFVVGNKVEEKDLENIKVKKNITYTKEQEQIYRTEGGLPRLDYDYTVFGEVYEGLDVLLKINRLETNENDFPIQPVTFSIKEIIE